MSRALWHVFLASLWRHRLATGLSLLAIALGVALGLAVQLIHSAALDELGRGMRLLNGEADLQVLGPRGGFGDALYLVLAQRPEVAEASPLLEVEARLAAPAGETLRIFGIDAFRAGRITPALVPERETPTEGQSAEADPLAVLRPDALFLSPSASRQLGLSAGDQLELSRGVRTKRLRIAGSVPGAGAGQMLGVMDIAAVQQGFDRIGRLTRIDLRLAPGVGRELAQKRLRAALTPGVAVMTPADAESEASGLSRAYRANLTMLAAIALLTGGFLVFSSQLLSVARRRQELALLRALGFDRRMFWRGLLAEGAALGLAGAVLGVVLAYGLTALAFASIGADLGAGFFRGVSPTLVFKPAPTLLYLGLGVLAGMAGAWLPAREAVHMAPARGLRSGGEVEVLRAAPRWGAILASLIAAVLLCLLPPIDGIPLFGYLAALLILAGAVLALPGTTAWVMARLRDVDATLLRLAAARLCAAPGQAVVAGVGVVASAALAISMAIMVYSFRDSLDEWLAQLLPADLYLRSAEARTGGYLDPEALARVGELPGVERLRPARFESVRLGQGGLETSLIARPVCSSSGLPLVAGSLCPPAAVNPTRPAWISEALADRLGLEVGGRLSLPLAGRLTPFSITGIWRDYARQRGAIVIELEDYRALTGDSRVSDLGLFLSPGTQAESLMAAVREMLGEQVGELVRPGELRGMILQVFDRSFLVTYLMEAVAVTIALFGISTTFAAMASSRRKEFGILRHLGLRRRQIGALVSTEAALTTAVGVFLGLAAGGAIAMVLIGVINPQSFHWSMDLRLPVAVLAAFSLSLILLAALAARVAGHRAMSQDAVLAVREDW